ncbi:MAG TPA: energy transducer TonB [Steroidobacteraceae bacterium]|jgi:protein TonB|nr:energy transducer TonB [Steroidobacteraceae bacterium]
MSAYYPQQSQGLFSKRAIVFIAIIAFHALIIYAFATGLVTNGARIINTILQTNIIQTQKVQELPPPPPHVDLKVPPPVTVIAPEVQINIPVAPPPIHVAPVVKVAPAPIRVPPAPIIGVSERGISEPDTNDYYPDASRRNNEEGHGIVHICVDTRGRVADAKVSVSTGHPMLDEAAVKLAKAYRFRPATQGGKPVPQCTGLPVRFTLTGG